MTNELKIAIIGAISGAVAGISVSMISGYFQYSTTQTELTFEREKIEDERHFNHKKELRGLIAEYNVATNNLYSKIRANDVGDTMDDLLEIKKVAEEIKLIGSIDVTDAVNHHAMSLLEYFNKFRTDDGKKLHEAYVQQSAKWTIITRMQFEHSK